MNKRQKTMLIRILTAAALLVALHLAPVTGWARFGLYMVPYLVIGYDILLKALKGIRNRQVFDENFLMAVATIGAIALALYEGSGDYTEAIAVMLFYQVGEWFQSYATGKSRKSIAGLMDIRPDYANIVRDGGSVETVDPSEVKVGDIILINPGEKIPLDGVIVKGASTLDTKALTGESLPREAEAGGEVISGCVNLTSQLEVRVTKEFYDSTVSKILELVENASEQKSRAENFITKFAKYYTPIVCGVALLLAVIPGFITMDWSTWVYRALSFLVVSCPCALVISIPLSFFAGIGAASRYGILVKGSNYLEKFNHANIFVFDKTGTLTKGNFAVAKIAPEAQADEILRLAAIAEHDSNHPIAKSIVARYGKETEVGYTLTNVAGAGIIAQKGAETICCGNEKLMAQNGIDFVKETGLGTVVYVAKNGKFVGSLLIADEIKPETKQVVGELNAMGCKTIMLTGDNEAIAQNVAQEVGLTGYKASLLPQNKVEEVEKLLAQKGSKDVLCFVGDGVNDAPVLMRSDIGIAMGGVGSDAAIEASDIVLMKDDLKGISLAKRIAGKTMAIVFQNIVFSIAIKVAILILSAFGVANMWLAVFGDVGVAVLAILNAMRVNSRYEKSSPATKHGK